MKFDLTSNQKLILFKTITALGLEPIEIPGKGEPIAVVSFGAGLLMAVVDHLRTEYPDIALIGVDLPGNMGTQRRCMAIDYFATTVPTVLVMWSALVPLSDYAKELKARNCRARCGWVYLRPDAEESEAKTWSAMDFQPVELLQALPLGSFGEVRNRLAQRRNSIGRSDAETAGTSVPSQQIQTGQRTIPMDET